MKKRLLAIILGVVMVASLVACGAKEEAPAEDAAVEEEAVVEEEAPAEEEAEAPAADLGDMYEVVAEAGTKADVNEYYMGYGVESYVDIQAMGGIVKWPMAST